MNLDDRLDVLLSASGQPVLLLPDDEDTRALAPLLAAARMLASLHDAQPSARFADELERQMLAHAMGRVKHAASTLPAPADVDGDAPSVPLLDPGVPAANGGTQVRPERAAPRWLRSARSRQGARARGKATLPIWGRALAAACVLLALGSGLFAAAANAQPGSTLYGLHRVEQWAQVTLASPADKARLHLQYANDALTALDRAAAQHDGDPAYAGALAVLQSELAAAATAIAALPAGQTRDTLAVQLASLQQRVRDDLRTALARLGWSDRVASTTALGGLGEHVPHVTNAAIHEIASRNGQGAVHDGHRMQVVVSGSGFGAGTRLVINGQPAGTVISVSDGTLVAQVSLDPSASGHVISVGVQNPDGTAAQTAEVGHGAAVTLTPVPTATPHRGDHGG